MISELANELMIREKSGKLLTLLIDKTADAQGLQDSGNVMIS